MTIDHASGQDTDTARLAAEIAVDQPTLLSSLRRSSERTCRYAGLLEAELLHFRDLEPYLENAVKLVVKRTGRPVDDELFERLCNRLGVSEVRIALQRVADAHPDA
jgi:hypothetical protein